MAVVNLLSDTEQCGLGFTAIIPFTIGGSSKAKCSMRASEGVPTIERSVQTEIHFPCITAKEEWHPYCRHLTYTRGLIPLPSSGSRKCIVFLISLASVTQVWDKDLFQLRNEWEDRLFDPDHHDFSFFLSPITIQFSRKWGMQVERTQATQCSLLNVINAEIAEDPERLWWVS